MPTAIAPPPIHAPSAARSSAAPARTKLRRLRYNSRACSSLSPNVSRRDHKSSIRANSPRFMVISDEYCASLGENVRCNSSRFGVEDSQLPSPFNRITAQDPGRADEGVGAHPENPVGLTELGRHRIKRRMRVVVEPIEVPEARPVGRKMQAPVRCELGLENGLLQAAGDHRVRCHHPVIREGGQPQARAVPRHIRMVPFDPGQPGTVRRKSRRGIEIGALGQNRNITCHHVDGGQPVHRLRTAAMHFLNGDETSARRIDHGAGSSALDFDSASLTPDCACGFVQPATATMPTRNTTTGR